MVEQEGIAKLWENLKAQVVGETNTLDGVIKASKTEQEHDGRQRRWLRYIIAGVVVITLWCELVGMLVIVLLQGFKQITLNEWMLGFLTNGIIVQTFLGLRTIVTHLFPLDNHRLPSDHSEAKPPKKKS